MKLNSLTKYIIKAVFIEVIVAFIIFSLFYSAFFSFAETLEIFAELWFPIVWGTVIMYLLANFFGNLLAEQSHFKIWHGIAIIFILLLAGIIAGFLATAFLPNWQSFNIESMFPVLLVFLLFGGLPTLFIGIWLGYRLQNKPNVKTR